ncbi:MAG: N-acetylmuramoyl-L-alanine amidase [Porticoccaceae bacterium]|nr:N-acetylmuramoyl-L-alanine amidase [Porticoccaceae bacterium]
MPVIHQNKVLPTAPDYPFDNAGWLAMHPKRISNYGVPNKIVGICLHTPEEPSDNYESTPKFFVQDPAVNGSVGGTHYYFDNDGDIFQMARESQSPHAQGVSSSGARPNVRLPRPTWWDAKQISYNTMLLSAEIEGYAATIQNTMLVGGVQWKSLVNWIAYKCKQYKIPVNRTYIVGHGELATDRSDPGAKFPWAELIRDVDAIVNPKPNAPKPATYTVVAGDSMGVIAGKLSTTLNALIAVNPQVTNPNLIRAGQVLNVPGAAAPVPEPEKPPVAKPHKALTVDEAGNAFTIAYKYATGPVGSIADAKIEPTGETSGNYEVHRLLVRRR